MQVCPVAPQLVPGDPTYAASGRRYVILRNMCFKCSARMLRAHTVGHHFDPSPPRLYVPTVWARCMWPLHVPRVFGGVCCATMYKHIGFYLFPLCLGINRLFNGIRGLAQRAPTPACHIETGTFASVTCLLWLWYVLWFVSVIDTGHRMPHSVISHLHGIERADEPFRVRYATHSMLYRSACFLTLLCFFRCELSVVTPLCRGSDLCGVTDVSSLPLERRLTLAYLPVIIVRCCMKNLFCVH